MRIDGTLDIECAAWDRFAIAATYTAARGSEIHRSVGSLCDYLIARGGHWWAHAGGIYDLLAIAEELRRRSIKCAVDLSGHRVTRIVCGKLTLRDSWALVPIALDVAASIAGVTAPEFPFACRCGCSCPVGYCAIRPGDRRAALADYCAADARVLWLVLQAIEDFAQKIGLELRGTIGATAWATARATLGLPDADFEPQTWRAIRRAYFGGRVAIVRPLAAGPGLHYDLSSAYPASRARAELPCGEWRALGRVEALACLARQRPGIYECSVTVPDDLFMPPLPVREHPRDDESRTLYPIGKVTGAWTELELRSAIDRGCKVDSVSSAIVWSDVTQPFGPLVKRWYRFRRAVGKHSALGQWIRLLANSLPGKLAERPERKSFRMHPDQIQICDGRRPCTPIRCTGHCGAYEQLDLDGRIWSVPFFRPATSGHIHWAAYVTAHARGVWLDGADRVGTNLVYGDTDSIWTIGRRPPGPTGDALGHWELKHAWDQWQCVGAKSYRYRDPVKGSVIRTAGLSLTDDEWKRGGVDVQRGVMGFVEAARSSRGLFRRARRRYTLSQRGAETGRYGDRVLDASSGITYPAPHGPEKTF